MANHHMGHPMYNESLSPPIRKSDIVEMNKVHMELPQWTKHPLTPKEVACREPVW